MGRRVGKSAEKAPTPDSEERALKLEEYRHSFRLYAHDCLRIKTKKHGLQPLDLNYTQKQIVKAIAHAKKRGHAPRIVCLKSRQVGVSTVSEAILFWLAHMWPYRSGLVITHKDKATKNLFQMTRRYLRNIPEDMRPTTTFENVNEMEFDNDSRMQVETAGDARSYTAQAVHISELGFIERAEETLTAVLQTVPDSPDSLVILESTANGSGNTFHKVWSDAMDPKNRALALDHGVGWIPIFIPWFRHEEYQRPAWFSASDLEADERGLMTRYQLSIEQMAWRRWCIKTDCLGDEEKFQVEYPNTPEEAFLLSGRPVFRPDAVQFYFNSLPDLAPPQQEVEWVADQEIPEARFTETAGGRLRIFEKPDPRHTYIIGGDPSEGDRGSDATPLEVLDQMTLNQVAEWYGKAPPDLLAHYAFALGMYYNRAQIAGEANNHGILFNSTLYSMGYPNVYQRTTSEESVAGKTTQKPGWLQSAKNKHFIFDTGRRFVREKFKDHADKPIMLLRSPVLVRQFGAATYVRKDEEIEAKIVPNDPSHPEVGHLDALIAFLIALAVHRGSMASPLVPLPEDQLATAATQAMLMRERNHGDADALSVDLTGMSCDELFKYLDKRYALRTGRAGGPMAGMG